ncbi:unnamed protein product [Amoebophrya sp. A25]|nr:unnamed protein product [Amoebophrya sp. A25]|eukprot:GSA25T00015306001.1
MQQTCSKLWKNFSSTAEEADFWLCGAKKSHGLAAPTGRLKLGPLTGIKWNKNRDFGKQNSAALVKGISDIQEKCCGTVQGVTREAPIPEGTSTKVPCSQTPGLAFSAIKMGHTPVVDQSSRSALQNEGKLWWKEGKVSRWVEELCTDEKSTPALEGPKLVDKMGKSKASASLPAYVVSQTKSVGSLLTRKAFYSVPDGAWWWWSDHYGNPMKTAKNFLAEGCCKLEMT